MSLFSIYDYDFTMYKYRLLCKSIISIYDPITISDYLSDKKKNNYIMLRHDVDRKPINALKMAKIENEYGIISTYYFRINTTDKAVMDAIYAMGHEIGYHYEDLTSSKGNEKEAIISFSKNLRIFRKYNIKSICMHGKPLSKHDNRDLWKKYNYHEYGINGEAYLDIRSNDINYYSDTGRTWSTKFNVRDILNNNMLNDISNTNEMINKLIDNRGNYYILVHPERWADGFLEWIIYYLQDYVVNLIKRIILLNRKNK